MVLSEILYFIPRTPFVPIQWQVHPLFDRAGSPKNRPWAPAPQKAVPKLTWPPKKCVLTFVLKERATLGLTLPNGVVLSVRNLLFVATREEGPATNTGTLPFITSHVFSTPVSDIYWGKATSPPNTSENFMEGQKNLSPLRDAQVSAED